MTNLIKYIIVIFVLLLACSCNDDFLYKETTYFGEGTPIVIFPEMDASDYNIYCPDIGNAEFTVTDYPSWLIISSISGQFIKNNAILSCKANKYRDFSEIGFYNSYLTMFVEGIGNVIVQVSYVSEDKYMPELKTQESDTIYFKQSDTIQLFMFSNQINGYLRWMVVCCPEWLSVSEYCGDIWIGSKALKFFCKRELMQNGSNTAIIYLITNDKNNKLTPITVIADNYQFF